MQAISYNTKEGLRFLDNKNIRISIIKIMAVLLIICLNSTGLSEIGRTLSYFNDSESGSAVLSAGLLDFMVTSRKEGELKTYSQGGWSTTAHGNNAGTYRDANFDLAFPGGVTIGDSSGHTILFTSSEAIKDFLPGTGTPAVLTSDYTDPSATDAGVLAGQVLALALNIGFDLYDPGFASSDDNLKDYILDGSATLCNGLTVQDVFDEANIVLAGLPDSFSPSDINDCVTWINEKFDVETGAISQFVTIAKTINSSLNFQYNVQVEKTGGNDFCNDLTLQAFLEGSPQYSGTLLGFVSSLTVYSSSADEWVFKISLPEESDPEDNCSFDFVFSGWQMGLPVFGGFSDIERVDDPVYGTASVSLDIGEEFEASGSEKLDTIINEFLGAGPLDSVLGLGSNLEQCDNSHLGLCNTQELCGSIGLYWYSEQCNLQPLPVIEDILGCTDSLALNYNPEAVIGDNSCEYFKSEPELETVDMLGCTDDTALNYNLEATIDDNSCVYEEIPMFTEEILEITTPIE